MKEFGLSMTDIAENAPKQGRTLEICQRAVCYARQHPELLEDFLRTKRVPLAKLAEGADAERKTLERHRKYLAAVLLICTNGYEILRGHIMQVLKGGNRS
jgi:RNA polymerase sigma factor